MMMVRIDIGTTPVRIQGTAGLLECWYSAQVRGLGVEIAELGFAMNGDPVAATVGTPSVHVPAISFFRAHGTLGNTWVWVPRGSAELILIPKSTPASGEFYV